MRRNNQFYYFQLAIYFMHIVLPVFHDLHSSGNHSMLYFEKCALTRYTHAHHVPHAENVERSDEMLKHGRDNVEDFEDVSGTLCCPVHRSASEVKPRF